MKLSYSAFLALAISTADAFAPQAQASRFAIVQRNEQQSALYMADDFYAEYDPTKYEQAARSNENYSPSSYGNQRGGDAAKTCGRNDYCLHQETY